MKDLTNEFNGIILLNGARYKKKCFDKLLLILLNLNNYLHS